MLVKLSVFFPITFKAVITASKFLFFTIMAVDCRYLSLYTTVLCVLFVSFWDDNYVN